MVSEWQSITKLWKGLELGLGNPVHLSLLPRWLGPTQTLTWAVICEQRHILTTGQFLTWNSSRKFHHLSFFLLISQDLAKGYWWKTEGFSFTWVNATSPHRLPLKWGGNHSCFDHVHMASADICPHAITDETLTAEISFLSSFLDFSWHPLTPTPEYTDNKRKLHNVA